MKLLDNIRKNKLFATIFALVFIVQFGVLANHLSELEGIPSCLYGCAPWMSQGFLKDLISDPTNIWKSDGLTYENFPAVMPKGTEYLMLIFYYIFGGIFEWDFFESWKVVIPLNLVLFPLFFVGGYYIFYKLTGSKELALLATTSLNFLNNYPIVMYSSLARFFSLFVLFIIHHYCLKAKKYSYKAVAILVIFSVISNHFHPGLTVLIYTLHASALLIYFWKDIITFNIKKILDSLYFRKIVSIVLISGVLTLFLPWWNYAIFVSGGNIGQETKINDSVDFSDPSMYFGHLTFFIERIFFTFSSPTSTFFSIFSLLGFLGLFLVNSKKLNVNENLKFFCKFYLVGYFIAGYHYLVMTPLLGNELAPIRTSGFGLIVTQVLLSSFAVLIVANILVLHLKKLYKIKKKNLKTVLNVLYIFGSLILLISSVSALDKKAEDRFYRQGFELEQNPQYNIYKDLYYSYYAGNNIRPEDTILISSNEISMTLHNLVGVDIINGRYGYYYQYVDYQPYWLDSAIILYSDNQERREEVIQKYLQTGKDLYIYWDFYWIQSEFVINNEGQIVTYSNPLKFIDQEFKDELRINNISYFEDTQSFEPNTYNRDRFRKFDLAVVSPANYRSAITPWKEGLDQNLEKVWSYELNGNEVAALYKVSLS